MGQPGDDDPALLAAYVAGDADAFVALYRRQLPAIVQFFVRRTGNAEVSADLTAEVFAAALQSAEHYKPSSGPVLAWLYGIAGNKLADSYRRGRVEDHARQRLSMDALPFSDADLDRVDELVSTSIDPGVLRAAVAALPASQREPVIGRVVAERSYTEIAAEMSCSELLIRQRVSRGLRALRARIEGTR
jgi:RNA polymerase sigma-70 factor (ECF subfamily)